MKIRSPELILFKHFRRRKRKFQQGKGRDEMPSDSDSTAVLIIISSAIALFCLVLYGIASAGQVAIERANEKRLETLYEKKPGKLKRALRHIETTQRFMATTSLLRMLCMGIPAVALCIGIGPLIASMIPLSGLWPMLISDAVVLFLMSNIWLFFASLLPRKVAANHPEKTLGRTMGIINVFAVLLRPMTAIWGGLSNAILRAAGLDPHLEDQPVTEEQIMRLVDESEEDGEIAGVEADMIENIFDFNDTMASEIMTHRIDVTAVEDTAKIQDVVKLSVDRGYSRIPVYHGTIDTIIGVVYVKDLLRFIGKQLSRNIPITRVMRKPHLVPVSREVNKLFAEMTERRFQFAVLIDEYGGTAGIVTMEDILESIVGSIQDEYDNEKEDIMRLSENVFTVDGSTPVDEISDLLEKEIPEGDYDTIAGFVVDRLGNLPDADENPSVMFENVKLHVLEVEDNRIEKIMIEILEKKEQGEEE